MLSSKEGFLDNVYGSVDAIIERTSIRRSNAVVITPTTGSPYLAKAVQSVNDQDYLDIDHLIVVDGANFDLPVRQILSTVNSSRLTTCVLPFNTGGGGLNGHRIYASFPLLVDAKFVFFLDEDNWWDFDHVSSLVALLEDESVDWAYSMRKIFTYNEKYVAEDNCESIGKHLPYSHVRNGWPSYVDTNCYAFKRRTIVQVAHNWYHPLRADRYFFHKICAQFPAFVSSRKYSVNYRLKKNGPVPERYIIEGNQYMMEKYSGRLPWV